MRDYATALISPGVFTSTSSSKSERVLDHRVSQVFRGSPLLGLLAPRRRAQSGNTPQARMVDGNVVGALIEFGDGIAARLQQRRDQLIGFRDGALWVIDKSAIARHASPL